MKIRNPNKRRINKFQKFYRNWVIKTKHSISVIRGRSILRISQIKIKYWMITDIVHQKRFMVSYRIPHVMNSTQSNIGKSYTGSYFCNSRKFNKARQDVSRDTLPDTCRRSVNAILNGGK